MAKKSAKKSAKKQAKKAAKRGGKKISAPTRSTRAKTGCCTIILNGNSTKHAGKTKRECEEMAAAVGATASWKAGAC